MMTLRVSILTLYCFGFSIVSGYHCIFNLSVCIYFENDGDKLIFDCLYDGHI